MFRKFAALSVIAALLTACTPSVQYGGSKKDGAFFKIPNGWFQVSNTDLNKEEAKSTNQADIDRLSMVTYQAGFSTAKGIKPLDVFMLDSTNYPVVFARFRDLFPEERNAISLNSLRNIVLPVTSYVDGTKTNDKNFVLLDDQELTQKGGKGVNLLFSFDYNGVNETVNQTAFYSNDQNKIYLFIVRCSTTCYNKNQKLLANIVKSFTLRGVK